MADEPPRPDTSNQALHSALCALVESQCLVLEVLAQSVSDPGLVETIRKAKDSLRSAIDHLRIPEPPEPPEPHLKVVK